MPTTLTLAEAAALLKCHEDTISQCIEKRGLPAVKVGRAWVLVDDDVIAWLRTQYDDNKPIGEQPCGFTDAASEARGGSTSPSLASRALTAALAPQKRRPRGNGPPRLTAISGASAASEKPPA